MRPRKRSQVSILRIVSGEVIEPSGGVYRLKTMEESTFKGLVIPPEERIVRAFSGVRLASTWAVIPEGKPNVNEKDYVYLPGDPRTFVITGLRRYPGHMEIDLELLQ